MATLKTTFADGDVLSAGATTATDVLNGITERINTHTHDGSDTALVVFTKAANTTGSPGTTSTTRATHVIAASTFKSFFVVHVTGSGGSSTGHIFAISIEDTGGAQSETNVCGSSVSPTDADEAAIGMSVMITDADDTTLFSAGDEVTIRLKDNNQGITIENFQVWGD